MPSVHSNRVPYSGIRRSASASHCREFLDAQNVSELQGNLEFGSSSSLIEAREASMNPSPA